MADAAPPVLRRSGHEPAAPSPGTRPHRSLRAQLRYFAVLVRRFRFTLGILLLVMVGGPTLMHHAYRLPDGSALSWPRAAQAIYFLMIGNPTLEFPSVWYLELLYFAVPPLGVIGVADGLVRFAYLFFSRQRQDKEWIQVLAQTMSQHVVLCGAGRVGYRIQRALRELGVPVLVVEKREDAAFVQALRAEGVPVIVEDAATAGTMSRVNLAEARAVVLATDDDLANINIALDARRIRPGIRVVMRVFDEDLAERVEGSFAVDALSTSALAAPAFAAAALDPGVLHSFWLGGELHVLAEWKASEALAGRTVESLRQEGLLVARVQREGQVLVAPDGAQALRPGDTVHLQGPFKAYDALARRLRPTPG
jgi:Trk K+ transport system NAD-binding subunit